jgi:hypothetical protein
MAVTNTPIFIQAPKNTQITIVAADASAQKVVCTAGANGSKVIGLILCSDDTSARVIQMVIKRGGTSILIGSVNVPTLSGTDGAAPSVNAIGGVYMPGLPIDSDGNEFILLESGDTLEIKSLTTVTAAKTISATCIFGNF